VVVELDRHGSVSSKTRTRFSQKRRRKSARICSPPKRAALRAAQYPHRPGSQADRPPRFLNEAMRPWADGGSPGVPAFARCRPHVGRCREATARRSSRRVTLPSPRLTRNAVHLRKLFYQAGRIAAELLVVVFAMTGAAKLRSDRDLADVCSMAAVYNRRRLAVLGHPGAAGPAASRARAARGCRPVVARNSGVPRARRRLPFHVCKDRSRARQTLAQVRWRTSSASA
jgi:hypothetical protein